LKIFFYDTECNSLDTENGFIQELAWAIFDSKSWRCLSAQSFLINWGLNHYVVDPEAFSVTGLSKEFCDENGEHPLTVFQNFMISALTADAFCGHNAVAYDFPMVDSNIKRAMLDNPLTLDSKFKTMPHIDTLTDVEYPSNQKQLSLKYLALDHGFILNNAHEALADVFACAHILKQYDVERALEIAKTPMIKIRTKIDWNNVQGREKVKQARMYWNPTLKCWEKNVREFFVPGIQLHLGSDIELGIER
jgi:DNA polymerase III epsilon subunit-like protein